MGLSRAALQTSTNSTYADGQAAGAITEADHRSTFVSFANAFMMPEDFVPLVATDGPNDYIISLPLTSDDWWDSFLLVKIDVTNTGPSTMEIGFGSPVAIKKNGSEALVAGDLVAGEIVMFAYDGTNLQIIGRRPTRTAFAEEFTTTVALSNANIASANSSPVELVPAPGSGLMWVPTRTIIDYKFATAAFATNTHIYIRVGTDLAIDVGAGAISAGASFVTVSDIGGSALISRLNGANANINFFIDTGNPTGGGTSTARVTVTYHKIALS